MGLAMETITAGGDCSHPRTHMVFILSNYILLGAASSCVFLTLSLRLFPSLIGFLFILLQIVTIAGAVSGCAAASRSPTSAGKFYGAHMVATVLTAIFQGSVSVLIFTRPSDFLGHLKSYVREDDGVLILKLAGGLCVVMFCLEWVVLTLAFFLNYFAYVEGRGISSLSQSGIGSLLRRSLCLFSSAVQARVQMAQGVRRAPVSSRNSHQKAPWLSSGAP